MESENLGYKSGKCIFVDPDPPPPPYMHSVGSPGKLWLTFCLMYRNGSRGDYTLKNNVLNVRGM